MRSPEEAVIGPVLLVALGGGIGAALRHLALGLIAAPWGVAAINVLGSTLMGAACVLLPERSPQALLVMTGVLGGFTTFSAFSLDALRLWQSGHISEALLYVGSSVILSLAGVALGATAARGFAA